MMITSEITPAIRDASAIPTKISFVGAPAVGKTTIVKILQGKVIDGRYLPTQGFDLGRILVENHAIRLFDFGGQKAYITEYLQQYVLGSELVFVVTDSTPQNVLASKELISFIQGIVGEDIAIAAIANKQDLSGHMDPNRVERVLQVPTYALVATSEDAREELVGIIQKELQISHERKVLQMEVEIA